ncbi:MAG: hypothetical protein HYT72_00815 [Candidatus Aenigmarchaeota archaeon]|nr:hypothetical protein [Candidatus Aenigmarchaeota archaeon]
MALYSPDIFRDFVSEAALARAMRERGSTPLGTYLVRRGDLTPGTLATVLAYHNKIFVVNPDERQPEKGALQRLPKEKAAERRVLPYALQNGNRLVVVIGADQVEEGRHLDFKKELEAETGMRVAPAVNLGGALSRAYVEHAYDALKTE